MYKQVRRKNEIITEFDAETSGNYEFAAIWERLFSPLLLNQVELHQQAGARKESHGEELQNIPSEMLFMRDASIAFAKHPRTDWIFFNQKTHPTFLYIY